MGYDAIIIGIGGLILSVLTYFAGVKRAEKRHKDEAKEKRIDVFISSFSDRYHGGGYILEELIPSGINDLDNDSEIHTAFEKLQNRLAVHPLRNWNQLIEKIGYKIFFQHVLRSGLPLTKHTIDKFIDELKPDK